MSMKSILGSLAAAAVTVALAAPGTAGESTAKTYHFGTATKHTNITFVSEAEIENIYGSTSEVSGTTTLDFEKGKGSASIAIPVKSLRTGIDKRDEHLRSDGWLDEAKYPQITFTSDEITTADEKKVKWTAKGKLTIKGTTHDLTADVRITRIPENLKAKLNPKGKDGDWVRVTTTFDVDVTEFGVEIPEGVGPKVSATWTIKFNCFATTDAPDAK